MSDTRDPGARSPGSTRSCWAADHAAISIHLASAADLQDVTGRYVANSKPKQSAKRSYDQATAAQLSQVSADLVGLAAAG